MLLLFSYFVWFMLCSIFLVGALLPTGGIRDEQQMLHYNVAEEETQSFAVPLTPNVNHNQTVAITLN